MANTFVQHIIYQSSYTNQTEKKSLLESRITFFDWGVRQFQLLVRGYKMNTVFYLVFKLTNQLTNHVFEKNEEWLLAREPPVQGP